MLAAPVGRVGFLGALNLAANSGARHLSHAFSLAVTFALSTNLTQYVAWKALTRTGSHLNRYGPTYLLALSIPLTTIDSVRHEILDNHLPVAKHLTMYKRGSGRQEGFPDYSRLSVVGWTITIACTYLGYICLITGVLWAADIVRKVRHAYREIRIAQKEAQERQVSGRNAVVDEEEALLSPTNGVYQTEKI